MGWAQVCCIVNKIGHTHTRNESYLEAVLVVVAIRLRPSFGRVMRTKAQNGRLLFHK